MTGTPSEGGAEAKSTSGLPFTAAASTATQPPAPGSDQHMASSFQAINRQVAAPTQHGGGNHPIDAGAQASPQTDGAVTQKPSQTSQTPAEIAQSAPVQPESLDAAANYGTRSRRTGNQRLNYAEDQEMTDYDFSSSAATTTAAAKKAAAGPATTASAAEAKRAKEPAQFASVNGSSAHSNTNHSVAKDPASTSASNPKKRKAAGTPSNATSTPPANNAASSAIMRKSGVAATSAQSRETNMMTFMKSKSCLNKKGELVADDGTKLSVNDHVYLVCEPPGEPYYLCRIMEFLHVDSDNANSPVDSMRVNWYYRPRDVQRFNSDSRLVYATMHSDMCPLTSLRGLCTIKHRSEIPDLDAYRKERDSFYFVQVFDRFIRRWYECIPTSQIINVPEKVKKALDERWKFVAVEIGRVKELTSAVKTCKRCARYCASQDSVDCAICKCSYHMNCVQPPLPKKPSRGFAWACGPCSRASERRYEISRSGEATEAEEEEIREEEELPAVSNDSTRAPSPSGDEVVIDEHPATQAEIALAKMWPMRYLGIHCRVEDALQYDDRAIYPRASSRLGPRHQANVNVWHGRPVELVKPAEIKKRYVKAGAKKEGKLSKETLAAMEADRAEKAKRPKWVYDEPAGYVARGEDYPEDDPRCTAKLIFKMPDENEARERGLAGIPSTPQNMEVLVDEYVHGAKMRARSIGVPPFGTNFLDKAVELLTESNYNVKEAWQKVTKIDRVKDLREPVLTKAELAKFEEGVSKYGSEHRLVRLHMKTNMPNSQIVRFYYLWKKTPQGREIWGKYPGRKGKKRVVNDNSVKIHDEVAHDGDDSAFDNDKAAKRKRGFQCKFCGSTHARQWRRAPGAAPGQTVLVDVKGGPKDKRERMLVALCVRCANLWRKYAIQWEDVEEVAKKVSSGGGRALKRRIDEELLRELMLANEAAAQMPTPEPLGNVVGSIDGPEPVKKKSKFDNSAATPAPEPPKKKEKPPPPPKLPTPPPPPIVPAQPTWKALPCAVCSTGDNTVACAHCQLTVHRSCFGLSPAEGVRSNGDVYWVCEQCQNDRNPSVSTEYTCCLCLTEETLIDLVEPPRVSHKKKTDREREKERMEKELADNMRAEYKNKQLARNRPVMPREPLKRTTGNNWVHVQCAVFTPEIRFSSASELEIAEGFQLIPHSRYEAICKLCKNKDHHNKVREDKGACVTCLHCSANFHVSCAFEAGYQFGFDVTPVKGSRKDHIATATLTSETGSLTAAIWCKEHTVKSIVHPIHEVTDESGKSALQVYAEKYKQADLTLTGTVRKANQVQLTKDKAQQVAQTAQSGNRRESTTNNSIAAAVRRGARNSATEKPDDGATETSFPRESSAVASERRCAKCKIDVTPKWHLVEKDAAPASVPKEPTPPKSPPRRLSMTLGEIADQRHDKQSESRAVNVDITGAPVPSEPQPPPAAPVSGNGRPWEAMAERETPKLPVNGDIVMNDAPAAPPSTEIPATNEEQSRPAEPGQPLGDSQQPQAPPELLAASVPAPPTQEAATEPKPTEYLCHKCFVKRKLDPTPSPPSPPPRMELSPPKPFPLHLDWNAPLPHTTLKPQPRIPWEDQLRRSQPPTPQNQPPAQNPANMTFLQAHQIPPPNAPSHGFPPTFHHQPNGYNAPPPGPPPPNAFDRPNGAFGFPHQPSPNPPPYHQAHRPTPMSGFPPPGQPMQNGIASPHGSQHPKASPTYGAGPQHPQYPPRRTESPFPSQLPPLGGPLYGSPSAHFAHPDAVNAQQQQQQHAQQPGQQQQQQAQQQPQPPPPVTSAVAPVQASPQLGLARTESQTGQTGQNGQPSTPREGQGGNATPVLGFGGASASPSLRNLLS